MDLRLMYKIFDFASLSYRPPPFFLKIVKQYEFSKQKDLIFSSCTTLTVPCKQLYSASLNQERNAAWGKNLPVVDLFLKPDFTQDVKSHI